MWFTAVSSAGKNAGTQQELSKDLLADCMTPRAWISLPSPANPIAPEVWSSRPGEGTLGSQSGMEFSKASSPTPIRTPLLSHQTFLLPRAPAVGVTPAVCLLSSHWRPTSRSHPCQHQGHVQLHPKLWALRLWLSGRRGTPGLELSDRAPSFTTGC